MAEDDVDALLQDYLAEGRRPRTSEQLAAQGVLELTDELEQLLARYLHTVGADAGEPDAAGAASRNSTVDDLLCRCMIDGESGLSDDLTRLLQDHLAAGAGDQPGTRNGLTGRLRAYAEHVLEEEDLYAFGARDENTIQGVPPPNAPPIPAGTSDDDE